MSQSGCSSIVPRTDGSLRFLWISGRWTGLSTAAAKSSQPEIAFIIFAHPSLPQRVLLPYTVLLFRVRHCGWLVANATKNLSVGDQKFRTGRQQATNLFSPLHLKFQGKWAFFKRKHKAAKDNCSKTKRRSYDHHIYPVPYCFSGFSKLTSPCLRWKIWFAFQQRGLQQPNLTPHLASINGWQGTGMQAKGWGGHISRGLHWSEADPWNSVSQRGYQLGYQLTVTCHFYIS